MAGGMILMFVLLSLYPVPVAMVLHGLVQLTANGSRCFILKSHIITEINLNYFLGALIALITFTLISFAPQKAYVLIMLGLSKAIRIALHPNAGLASFTLGI